MIRVRLPSLLGSPSKKGVPEREGSPLRREASLWCNNALEELMRGGPDIFLLARSWSSEDNEEGGNSLVPPPALDGVSIHRGALWAYICTMGD